MNHLNYIIKQLLITRHFLTKLGNNFHELTLIEKIIYLLFIRPFWPAKRRFFYEGHFGLPGQMHTAERQALYETILKYRPRFCLEIGTYTGGGSTFFLASAFKELGQGKLLTLEANPYYHKKASSYYGKHLPDLASHLDFILGDDIRAFDSALKEYGTIDCLLLDGAEDARQTLDQYEYFSSFFTAGTILMLHDWNTEKTRLLKPLLLADPKWRTDAELKPPKSVGLIIMERLP